MLKAPVIQRLQIFKFVNCKRSNGAGQLQYFWELKFGAVLNLQTFKRRQGMKTLVIQ
uniref:Uncharacterized protein n=1 Tax=Rhizophora mucronata TaxID=61149 RepID=A0A2P2Q1I2_RHIMU